MLNGRDFRPVALFFVVGTILCIYHFNSPIHDFGNYYFGSKFALAGISIRDIYEPYKFNLLIRNLPGMQHENFLENYAVVPPFTLLFYLPFTFFDAGISKLIFNILSLVTFSFFLSRLLKHLSVNSGYVYLLPLIFIIPFRNNILFGQTYLLLLGFLMAGFIQEEKKNNFSAAILYALSMALKISPFILLFYLLARKNFKLLILTISFSILLFISAAYFTGWNFMKEYLLNYIPRMSTNEINNPFATTYQSATVLLRNIFIRDQLLNPAAFYNSSFLFKLLSGLFTGILFFFFSKKLNRESDLFTRFSFTLLAGNLFTAYTSNYSLILMLPACIDVIRKKHSRLIYILILILAISSVPINLFQSLPLLLRFPRLYLLLILFFIFFKENKLISKDLKWITLSITFFIAVTFSFSKSKSDQSNYFLADEISLLSYDYEFRNGNLAIKIMEENGPVEKTIPLTEPVTSIVPLPLINNRIYYSGQLINGNDHKLKPLLINNNMIVYLSDKGRGIGFYAMRKIPMTDRIK